MSTAPFTEYGLLLLFISFPPLSFGAAPIKRLKERNLQSWILLPCQHRSMKKRIGHDPFMQIGSTPEDKTPAGTPKTAHHADFRSALYAVMSGRSRQSIHHITERLPTAKELYMPCDDNMALSSYTFLFYYIFSFLSSGKKI